MWIRTGFFLTTCAALCAGPVDFGKTELQAALNGRSMVMTIETELNLDKPETYRITAVKGNTIRVSGGDLRGLMYGLIEAADQIRNEGKITAKTGEPGLMDRGVRLNPSDGDLAQPTFYSTDRWISFFKMLARNRMNRFTLVLPAERIEMDRIRVLSRAADEFGVAFILGIRPPMGDRTLGARLRKILDEGVLVRGIEVQMGREPVEYFRTVIFPALKESGRRVPLDLHGAETRPDVVRAAEVMGLVIKVTGRVPGAEFADIPFHVPLGAELANAEGAPVRNRIASILNSGAAGFEIDLPGPNVENYERTYWSWGRAGYEYQRPKLEAAPPPKSATKKK